MKYLTIKKQSRLRADGRENAQAFVVRKTKKYGEVIEQTSISTRRPVLITGAHASGKSYWLTRLHKNADRVWASRRATPLHLHATWSISDWVQGEHLEQWWEQKENAKAWKRLTPKQRQDALADYLHETKAVLFIDDAHKLTGKKLLIAQACVRAAGVWVMAASDEGRLSPGLRVDVLRTDPQIYRLSTDAAYDATPIVIWVFILVCASMGFYELAAALGGLRMLSGGLRASKQN